ncbi:Spc97 / Spc98 family of spindle pole body component, putative isoform 1 [Theobroma cacao]|nr:Spc97 / Spc98 family of spindle pole body component, putative isoform 1 [Theobroma cacao]
MGEKEEEVLGNNSIEDVSWLCSLSESELDLLISLKMLAMKRARVIGHVQLAKNFDLKMLRALGFILMEYLKEKVKDSSIVSGVAESAAFIDSSNLLKSKLDDMMSIEELKEGIAIKTRKEFCKRPREKDAANRSSKRPRSSSDLKEETESC